MNILILGATGFVGSRITNLLLQEQYTIYCAGRHLHLMKQQFPKAHLVYCDFLEDTSITDWLPRLVDIDVIINCIGIFYHKDRNDIWKVHFNTPKAIYEAAQKINIKQIIHISALGVDNCSNEYTNSKLAIEKFLNSLTVPHIILRPSLIYGPDSKGSMDLLRKIAACPGLIPLPGNGLQEFQPIYVGDLAIAVKNLIKTPPSNNSSTLIAASSKKINLKEMVLSIRQWLGFKKGIFVEIPLSIIKVIAWSGDQISYSTVNSPAIQMLQQGNATSSENIRLFEKIAQIKPLEFEEGLKQSSASRKDRWAVRLEIISPFLKISLAIMWLFSAITSILPYSQATSHELLRQVGVTPSYQSIMIYGASLLNALIGVGLLLSYKLRINCILQIIVILFYSLIITSQLPYLWLEPFGPIVKNIPILLSIGILYILESE